MGPDLGRDLMDHGYADGLRRTPILPLGRLARSPGPSHPLLTIFIVVLIFIIHAPTRWGF
jgi:hypothetical protein